MDRETINQEIADEIDDVAQRSSGTISIPPVHSESVQATDAESASTRPLYRWVSSEEEFCIGVARDVEGRANDVHLCNGFHLGQVHSGGVFGLVSSELCQ